LIFSAAVFSTAAGFSANGWSLRIRSTVLSVTVFSLIDRSNTGATLGCSVMCGSTVVAGAAAVIEVGSVPACVMGAAEPVIK